MKLNLSAAAQVGFPSASSSCRLYFDGEGFGEGPGGLCAIDASDSFTGSSDSSAFCEPPGELMGELNGSSNPAACFTNSISDAVLGGWAGFAAVAT